MPLPAHRLLVFSDAAMVRDDLFSQVARALEGGPFSLVLREKQLDQPQRRTLAARLAGLLAVGDGELIVADPSWPVARCHLSAAMPPPVDRPRLLGRSHHAGEVYPSDVDYITHSPVHLTDSKPGYGPAVGESGLAAACARSAVPVFALGGITTPDRAEAALSAGAHGFAVMGAIMRSPDPGKLVAGLLAVLP